MRVYDGRGKATADLLSLDDEDPRHMERILLHHPTEYTTHRALERGEVSEAEPLLVDVLNLNPRQPGRLPDGFLQPALVHMVAPHHAGARVFRQPLRGKDVLPDPLPVGVGVLALQRERQVDRTVPLRQAPLVQPFHALQVLLEWRDDGLRQHGREILHPFAIPYDDQVLAKVHVPSPGSGQPLTHSRTHSMSHRPLP